MINNFVAKEGRVYIYISFAIFVFSYLFICDTLAFITFFITLFLIFIYRNNLKVKAKVDSLVSPISGEVVAIDKIDSQNVVYINVGIMNSHILIAPKDSLVKEEFHKNGLNFCTNSYKAKELNEKRVLSFDDIKLELISGRFNISHEFINEIKVNQYDKIGVFINGIVKIYIPSSYQLNLKFAQKVKVGEVL
ncbi:hypothetical protein Arnit_0710 [Arcobacter nitrofigilis DSM 7299]|uniref:Phosphatidylserine decarboxylase n=1 Tax=Arcobacter nitrofigilis (strain ATCC 33309 / DSM 7299 / CCUG 15893 / LMG 7604 / NCTC 12251 / CI) TaxID=572480 RepID=D5V2E2_ARCNC|nr:hypothetical protein [Arcobacter nitrofigilis]ADG92375.1 hypothetical protein Arnit_0710 [Arcobacter nitrofigilis DSM 7299]